LAHISARRSDDNIEALILIGDRAKQLGDAFGFRDINRLCRCSAADVTHSLLGGFLLDIGANNKRAVSRQAPGRGLADARSRADDYCYAAVQSKEFVVVHECSVPQSLMRFSSALTLNITIAPTAIPTINDGTPRTP